MLDKIMKYVLLGSGVFFVFGFLLFLAQAFRVPISPELLTIISTLSPITNTIFIFSLAYTIMNQGVAKDDLIGQDKVRALILAALGTVVIVPVIFSPSMLYPYIVGKAFLFRLVAILGFAAYIYLALKNKSFWPRLSPVVLTYGILTFVMLLAFIFSMDPYKSFWGNYERMEGYIGILCIFMFLVVLVSARLRDFEWKKLFKIHVYTSIIVLSLSTLQKLIAMMAASGKVLPIFLLPLLNTCAQNPACKTDATLGNSIYLSIYAALSAWIFAYVAIKYRGKYENFFWGLSLFAFVNLWFAGGRGAIIGMTAGILIALAINYYFNNKKKELAILIAGAMVVLMGFAGIVFATKKSGTCGSYPIVKYFCSTQTLFARFNVWQTAMISFREKPILGWGQENFIHAFNKNYNPDMYGQETYFDHPHNTYLGWLVAGGILGFLAYLLLLASVYWATWKSYMKEEGDKIGLAIAYGAFTTYFIHLFFVFDNLVSIIFFIFLAAYFTRNTSFGSLLMPSINPNKSKTLFYSIVVLTVFVVLLVWVRPLYANKQIINALSAPIVSEASIQGVNKTFQNVVKGKTFGAYEASELYLQKGLELRLAAANSKDVKIQAEAVKFSEDAYQNFQSVVASEPWNHRAKLMLGLYELNSNNISAAENTLKEALALAPNKQIAIMSYSQALFANGKVEEGINNLKKALDITPTDNIKYFEVWLTYVKMLLLANKDKEAIEVIRTSSPIKNSLEFEQLIYTMGVIFEARKDLRSVIGLLNDAIRTNPQNPNFYVWLANSLVFAGDYRSASQVIGQLNIINPAFVAEFNRNLQTLIENKQKK